MNGAPGPDEAARELYLRLLAAGGVFRAPELPAADQPALRQLAEAGLVLEIWDGRWLVIDPRDAWTRLRRGLRSRAAELMSRADAVAGTLADLALAYDRTPPASPDRAGISRLDEPAAIEQRIRRLVVGSRTEVLSMQPGGARPPGSLRVALVDAADLRGRGVAIRTLYQPGARTDPATADYAARATALGGRIRVLDEDFRRMLVFDRSVAVLAGDPADRSAAVIEDPAVVGMVVAMFERDWERAERVRWESPVAAGDAPLIAMLAQGLTQRAIGSRLGLSERTVAARIAELRERYEARTLFQLGWQARAGALPPE
ncbi:LuxR family transcriptional regulator [Kitasatospora sp. NPDC058965]|uniref:LuxR family transcriptional regulator n=1 Tax=Kitasatospora sp. NPDC058965 TaxID=3346682 RepID=UPI00367E36BD